MLDILGWVGSILAIAGACLNARQVRGGFLLYVLSNTILVCVGWYRHEMYNVVLFTTFLIIAAYGYRTWGKSATSV